MLGDAAKPGWSLKREKDVVDTLLELLTAGLMPRKRLEALDLNGLGVSVPGTSAWFLTGGALLPTPATLLPPPRASRASLQEGALAALDMSAPTGKKVPHPAAAAAGLPAAVGTAAPTPSSSSNNTTNNNNSGSSTNSTNRCSSCSSRSSNARAVPVLAAAAAAAVAAASAFHAAALPTGMSFAHLYGP